MILLYKTFLVPHLEYCKTVLVGLGTKRWTRRCYSYILYLKNSIFRTTNEGYEILLNLIGMNTLKDRRYYQALVLIYKCLNSIGPKYIADFLNLREVII